MYNKNPELIKLFAQGNTVLTTGYIGYLKKDDE